MALDDDIAFFTSHRLLGAMEHEALRLVAFSADRRSYRAGDELARQGLPALSSFLIVSGSLALNEHDDGRPASVVLGPGALVGELALFADTTHPATVMAREPSTVLVIRREVVTRVLNEFPGSAAAIHLAISEKLRDFSIATTSVKDALERIGG